MSVHAQSSLKDVLEVKQRLCAYVESAFAIAMTFTHDPVPARQLVIGTVNEVMADPAHWAKVDCFKSHFFRLLRTRHIHKKKAQAVKPGKASMRPAVFVERDTAFLEQHANNEACASCF